MTFEDLVMQLVLGLVSFLANLLSACAGGGAGLVQLPALIFLGLPFPIALATHKVASIALGLGAGLRHIQERNLNIGIALFILGFGLPGVWLGARIALVIPEQVGTLFLGIFTFGLGLFSINRPQFGIKTENTNLNLHRLFLGGLVIFAIGTLNGSFSSGTGLFVTLWLVGWFGLPYGQAVAYTLILVGLFWNGTGAFVLALRGEIMWDWVPMLIAGSLLGGYTGAQMSLARGSRFVKRAFEILSLIMGVSLMASALNS